MRCSGHPCQLVLYPHKLKAIRRYKPLPAVTIFGWFLCEMLVLWIQRYISAFLRSVLDFRSYASKSLFLCLNNRR